MARRGRIRDNRRTGETRDRNWWLQYLWLPFLFIIFGSAIAFFFQEFSKTTAGTLHIFCNADSVRVSLNREFKGYASAADTPLILQSLPAGQFILTAKKNGYRPFRKDSVKIAADRIATVTIEMIPQNAPPAKSSTAPDSSEKILENPLRPIPQKTFEITVTVPTKFKNAKIFIDGEWLTNAPRSFRAPQGRHVLRVEFDGWFYEEKFELPSSKTLFNIRESEFRKAK